MSDEESTIYLTTADKLLDETIILLKQIIKFFLQMPSSTSGARAHTKFKNKEYLDFNELK